MRASSSELAAWRSRIADHEDRSLSYGAMCGSIESEMYDALEAERWHALDMEARVREMAADRRDTDLHVIYAQVYGELWQMDQGLT